MGMRDVADVREVHQVVVVTDLEASLVIEDNIVEAADHLSVPWSEDSSRSDSAGRHRVTVGSKDHLLRGDFGLVVRVESYCREVDTLIPRYNVLFHVVDHRAARGVYELLDAVLEADVEDGASASDVYEFVDGTSEIVGGGGCVDDGGCSGLQSRSSAGDS